MSCVDTNKDNSKELMSVSKMMWWEENKWMCRSFNWDNREMMCTDITVHGLQYISLFTVDLQFKL